MTKEDYNEEPVFFCRSCLSLRVKTVAMDSDLDYCDECGSTDICQSHIDEWERLHKERYGFNFINK